MIQLIDSLVPKVAAIEEDLAREEGGFALFALLLRENPRDLWDLVVAAPWLKEGKKQGFHRIADLLKAKLTRDELLSLSRIVVIDEDNPIRRAIRSAARVEHGLADLGPFECSGIEFKKGYVITSV